MAAIHPDDSNFAHTEPVPLNAIVSLFEHRLGITPTRITAPATSQGQYHKVYFIQLPPLRPESSGRGLVLRVARKSIKKIKIENEVAFLKICRTAHIPVPDVIFYNSEYGNSELGFEFICIEKIEHPPLLDIVMSLSKKALDNILDQMVDLFIKMWDIEPGIGALGSRRIDSLSGNILPGPVLEETMWQEPDIKRYFHDEPYYLTGETFETLNPTGSYASWVQYISAFLQSYLHVMSIHPNLSHLHHLQDPLQKLIDKLEKQSSPETWIEELKDEPGLQGRLWHRDLHLGNFLGDTEGKIHGIIDWEFAGVGPSFPRTSSPLRNLLYGAFNHQPKLPQDVLDVLNSWPDLFNTRLAEQSPYIAEQWSYASNKDKVLGPKGNALSDIREFLRSCLEVGVRGWGNIEKGKDEWRIVVEDNLKILECM